MSGLLLALWLAAVPGAVPPHPAASSTSDVGVLILAHGGSPAWNDTVRQTVADAALPHPTEIAFGMGMHGTEVADLQAAVDRLEMAGVARIIAVPLLVSSASEVMRQYEYLLGVRPDGPWQEGIAPIQVRVPVAMTRPLDDDPVLVEVLADRAAGVSQAPDEETVVLIAHGPNDEADNARWLEALGRIGAALRQRGGFQAVVPVTMRDDAPEPVRAAATQQMREAVASAGRQGRAVVVPVLIAAGGIEHKIPQRLDGLDFAFQRQGLLPHPKMSQWIATQVQAAVPPSGGTSAGDEAGGLPVASRRPL